VKERFSERYGFGAEHKRLTYDSVPNRVRQDLCTLVFEDISSLDLNRMYVHRTLLGCAPSLSSNTDVGWTSSYDSAIKRIFGVIIKCQWYEFYDICEEMHNIIESQVKSAAIQFDAELTQLLRAGGMGYIIRGGAIERIGGEFTDKEISKARILLREQGFEGPDIQFEKAIEFFNQLPEADSLNCVKEAVGALEGIARILSDDHKANLDDIVRKLVARNMIPKPLDQVFVKVYAYRGDVPGVAHGLVGQPKPTMQEAELVLGMCASMIIYLAKKFGTEVV